MGLRTWLGLKKPPKHDFRLRKRTDRYRDLKNLRGGEALERFIRYDEVATVLDIGSGPGRHAALIREAGKSVTTLSLAPPADVLSDYLTYRAPQCFDGIWASHVLEHQPNVNLFLRKCYDDLRMGGVLAVSVPPLNHNLVDGHLSLWNAGVLLYNLIIAGFDCSKARVGGYEYDISVIVRKVPARLPDDLRYDAGDIRKIAHLFPFAAAQGVDGRLGDIDWDL